MIPYFHYLPFSVAKALVKEVIKSQESQDAADSGEEDSPAGEEEPPDKKKKTAAAADKKSAADSARAKKFGCHICKYVTHSSEILGHHINVTHYKIKRSYCYKCGKGE